jgi:CheY-like chemotaxis protein
MPFSIWPFGRPVERLPSLTVLIADDDPFVRAELEQFVSRRGCHAYFASDGTVAMRCLTKSRERSGPFGRIDVVIADMDLPGRSGIDLLMAAQGNRWNVAVVLTTAMVSPPLCAELVRLGAAAVLVKPVALPELDRTLVRIRESR